jgi:hypothetical protein
MIDKTIVTAALDPAVQPTCRAIGFDLDGRVKPGHDSECILMEGLRQH